MAVIRSCVFILLVMLAIAHFTESRIARVRRSQDDYDAFDDASSTGATAVDDNMFRDEGAGEENLLRDDAGDDGDEEEDDAGLTATLLSKPQRFVEKIGSMAVLPCNIANSSLEVVSWQHGETKLHQGWREHINKLVDTKTAVNDDWSLVVPALTAADEGNYTCQIMSDPPMQAVTHTLRVTSGNQAPRIISMEPSVASERRVLEGSRLRITCVAEGYPQPTLIWSKTDSTSATKETHRVKSSEGVTFERDALVIDNVQRRHEGEYFCMALNDVGKPDIKSVPIHVVGKPAVHVHKSLVNAALGVTAILGCTVHYEPRSVVTWLKDGLELQESSDVFIVHEYPTTTVRIPQVKEKDFGTYKCIARNHYGEHSRVVELVEEPVLEDLGVEGEALTWRVVSHAPLSAVMLEYRRTDAGADDWHRENLKPQPTSEKHVNDIRFPLAKLPSGKYEARSRAKNAHGWSAASNSVFFESGNETNPNMAESIQAAGVGGNVGSGATDVKSVITATIATCLLIRLL